MTFQRQTDKNPFRFHMIFLGMNPVKDSAHSRMKENIREIRHIYFDLGGIQRFTARATAPGRTFRTHTNSCSGSSLPQFILKGALLFELWTKERYRATRDADFLATGDNSPERFISHPPGNISD